MTDAREKVLRYLDEQIANEAVLQIAGSRLYDERRAIELKLTREAVLHECSICKGDGLIPVLCSMAQRNESSTVTTSAWTKEPCVACTPLRAAIEELAGRIA